jgi:hypothetical protein
MTETPDTADFSFTNRDVEGLIDALSRMAVKLPKEEWGLLLSIFAAAAVTLEVGEDGTEGRFSEVKVVGGVIEDPKDKRVVALREQLQKAHMPAKPPGAPLGDMISPPKTSPGK